MGMPNRLAEETSPYLLQHQDNPVDWYPWGDEAFEAADAADRPVLLSIGYSTCHWCHVMERESFEDEATAQLLNELFVAVKVDREERPDVDSIYMQAVQAMTGRGGWPMTLFLTPDRRPFFAGTYFPNEDRHGMPSFQRVMGAVHDAWTNRRTEVLDQAAGITEAIGEGVSPGERMPDRQIVVNAYQTFVQQFDENNGGFGGAPKFPQEPVLEFLLRVSSQPWAAEARTMLAVTLSKMAKGGIRDHLGGGFARYSVDDHWMIPHFEKMLYNNAELARIYLAAWQVTGIESFKDVAVETLEYLQRDMTHESGGIFAAEDADSQGREGTFYVFTLDELTSVVGDDALIAAAALGVSSNGNFEGSNVLHQALDFETLSGRFDRPMAEIERIVTSAKRSLFEARTKRVRPSLDDKIITEWNGLAMRAFAVAGAVLDEDRFLESARRIAIFARDHLFDNEGRLLRSWAKGKPGGIGMLADHAAMAVGLFTLYQATGEVEWFEQACSHVGAMTRRFSGKAGVVYATSTEVGGLITRPTDQQDNPTAAGASLAAEAYMMHAAYTGESSSLDRYQEILLAGAELFKRSPSAVAYLAAVHATTLAGIKEVALVGEESASLAATVWKDYRPHVMLAVDRAGEDGEVVPLLAGRSVSGKTLAYVCEEMLCAAPVETAAELAGLL